MYVAVALLASALRGQGQTAPRPQFEVASLKPNNGCEDAPPGPMNPNVSPGRLDLPCISLRGLIQAAYGTFGDGQTINPQPLPIDGLPQWAQSEYYSLEAKAEGPARPEVLSGPMLQAFLEERFQLKTHRETREMPVYALTIAKSGLKAPPLSEGGCIPLDLTQPPPPPIKGQAPLRFCGALMMGINPKGTMTMEVWGVSLKQFAQRLSGRVDRPVIDKTGTPGLYTFHLEFAPDVGRVSADLEVPMIFTALQEQLGLKLVPEKGLVEHLVIDHVEKPTAN
jgi:uncharacterized protein (TIGR03435 family)